MPYQNIDASITPADLQAIRDDFASVLQKLPFLINLTKQERQSLPKAGPDSVSFVENSLTASRSHSDILPARFDSAGFKNDVDLLVALTELAALAESVFSQIDDTRLAVGSEAFQGASEVYKYVKTAAGKTPGLKPVADQLGERFKKASKKTKPPNSGS